jgi:hypothetical protein
MMASNNKPEDIRRMRFGYLQSTLFEMAVPAIVAIRACIKSLRWQTSLSARIDRIRLSGALSNLLEGLRETLVFAGGVAIAVLMLSIAADALGLWR